MSRGRAKLTDDDRRKMLRARPALTPAECAFLIRRDKSTITRWIQKGLRTIDLGSKRYVPTRELLRWAADPDRPTRRPRQTD